MKKEVQLINSEPKIEIYTTGFKGTCQLGRAEDGKRLSDLVENLVEPIVIAVDGPWGSGKSFFLKCWVGAHQNENDGIARTVYFDAFKNDFLDYPLIGLTSIISERLGNESNENASWQKAKEAASKLVRPLFRTGLAVATAGVTELTGPMIDAALEAGSKELSEASKEFWKREDGKRAAMRGFREALADQSSQQKLVIVVDELDRCRPDYALNLLEVIKHFFDVPNVHFVLGVNLKELANSVRARYGATSNAEKYLKKFITVSMPLTNQHTKNTNFLTQLQYFDLISTQHPSSVRWKFEYLKEYLKLIKYNVDLSLRDIEKIVTLSKVSPSPLIYDSTHVNLYIGLLILQVVSPTTIQKARAERLSSEDVFSIFDFPRQGNPRDFLTDAYSVWRFVSWDYGQQILSSEIKDKERLFGDQQPKKVLQKMIANCLDVFRLME
jgi:hypothetical protein